MRLGCPRRRTSTRHLPFRCPPTRGYLPLLSGRSSQWPVTHRAQPAVRWASPPHYSRASSVVGLLRFTAGAEFVRVDHHYEPIASEARSLQACSKGHAVVICKIRYIDWVSWRLSRPLEFTGKRETRRGSVLWLSPLHFPSPGSFFFVPSYLPTEELLVADTPDRARAPLFIFRKIHLYGKTKKSTHGHQNQKPYCTHFSQPGLKRKSSSRGSKQYLLELPSTPVAGAVAV